MAKAKDLTGQKFGQLTVIERSNEIKDGVRLWLCQCDCGNTVLAKTGQLTTGTKKSCGCSNNLNLDLTGQQFHSLTVIKKSDIKKNGGSTFWECQCECGNITLARTTDLLSGYKKSCGCLKFKKNDLTGQKFGKLTVLEKSEEQICGVRTWKCQCECGNIILARTGELTSGSRKSCGCADLRKPNLVGQKFNRLTVLKKIGSNDDNSIVWECQCDCGTITSATTSELKGNYKKSCGCLKHEPNAKYIKGKKFGMLTVFKRVGTTEDRRAIWRCKCDCGKFINVNSRDLLNGNTKSCGCLGKEKAKANILEGGFYYDW